MHKFLRNLKENIELMKKEAIKRNAPVFYARDGFENNKFWTLIFVVLSSRTKDEATSKAVNNLIREYGNEKGLSKAIVKDVENLIYGVGFHKVKSKRIIEISKYILKNGFPKSYGELIKLPGVGRKTANVVLNILYKKSVIGVDTHVHRISNRIGIINTKTPKQTEEALNKIIPKKYKSMLNEVFVAFGQTICKPKNPKCAYCPIHNSCDYFKKNYSS